MPPRRLRLQEQNSQFLYTQGDFFSSANCRDSIGGYIAALSSSTNVTRLISCKVEIPVKTFCKADSRKLFNPSASAARRTSEPGRRSTIISRILSDKSSNS